MEVIDRSDGSYQQERLYLLAKIDRLEKDVNEAHKKYRHLDRRVTVLKVQMGIIAAGVGVVAAAAAEAVARFLFH